MKGLGQHSVGVLGFSEGRMVAPIVALRSPQIGWRSGSSPIEREHPDECSKFDSIPAYLASIDARKAETLQSILDFVLEEFPKLEAKLAWNVPHIHRDGKYVMGLAAYKKHLTVSPWSVFVMDDFRTRLAPLIIFKNCFQIPVDWDIDRNLLRDLVRARLAELN